jgi:glycosyltransferase involved in cell wall biosynthesis
MGLRILHAVEFYRPSVGGAQEVVRQVSERLAARGHDVTVATSRDPRRREEVLDGVRVAGFDVRGNAVRGLEGDVEGYRRFVAEGGFDVVLLYAAQQWTVDALLGVLGDVPGRRVLAPCGFSALRDPRYAGYFADLRGHVHDFDALAVHSETYQDARWLREEAGAGERLRLVPNGADEREFGTLPERGRFRERSHARAGAPLLLTVGGHTGLKGHAASIAAFRRSRAARRGTLAIVGNVPVGRRGCRDLCRARAAAARVRRPGRRVVLADPPRPAVVEAYTDADLFVFCSMVECSPLVLFEAMAAGLPFVTVDVGNAAEIAQWSGAGVVVPSARRDDGLVEADPEAVARAVDDLLVDEPRRRALGEAGRRAWRERFTWDAVTDRYEALYTELVAA